MCLIFFVQRSKLAQHTCAPKRTTAPSNLAWRYICKCTVTNLHHSLKNIKYEFSWNNDNLLRSITLQAPSKENVFHSSISCSFTDAYTV